MSEVGGGTGGPRRVALVGKPNVGKSSLLNRLAGDERSVVHDVAGTTVDPVDSLIELGGKTWRFVDTAGLRRKGKVTKASDQIEFASVGSAVKAMERSSVVVLLCDAKEGVAEQDAKILGLAADRGRAMIIALNKSDLLSKTELEKAEEDAREKISFAPFAPIVHVSAKTGRGLPELFATIDKVSEMFHRRIGTGELNRFFENVLQTRPPPTMGGRAPRLYYITQAETAPPVFVVLASSPDSVHFSYQRFVANQLRKHFEFDGVPIRIVYRERRRGGKGRKEAADIEAGPAPAPKTGRRPQPGDTMVPRKPKRSAPAPAKSHEAPSDANDAKPARPMKPKRSSRGIPKAQERTAAARAERRQYGKPRRR